jgi:membrane protease subunit (stomatin/prohibitin family)
MALDVIKFFDETGRTMVHREPQDGSAAFRIGSQLIVQETQAAVFYKDGKALDMFPPGRHTIITENIPLLANLIALPFGGTSPFQAQVYFISLKKFIDLKWGTKSPINFRDSELTYVQLRASGKFSIRITEPKLFMNELVATQGLYTTNEVEDYLRDAIVSRLNTILGQYLKTVFELPQNYPNIEAAIKTQAAEFFRTMGIELTDLIIIGIIPPEDVQDKINERSSMGAIGNLDNYVKFSAAQSILKAAGNESSGNTAGLGAGLGAGMGLANMMTQSFQNMNDKKDDKISADDIMATIEKLGKMKDNGLLTQEEFETKKKDLLAKL